ncbi:MAG: RNA-directed DNA polymerase [Patescibacteria group bacterium]
MSIDNLLLAWQEFIKGKRNKRDVQEFAFYLKCDIKKFFASVDQLTLIKILQKHVVDKDILNLLQEIIFSFKPNGLPLGNLTSQLFANVYLNEFDQFIKHKLKIKYSIRYADDFVVLSEDRKYLQNITPLIGDFLQNELKLTLHPDKIFIKTLPSGIDFLGWVNFKDHRILRIKTKKRMLKRIKKNSSRETLNSYLGLLKHGNTKIIQSKFFN